MNPSGPLSAIPRLSLASGTVRGDLQGDRVYYSAWMDDLLSDLSPSKRYRTPAEVRAIPNAQWEAWIDGNNLPFTAFSASADCQEVLRTIIKATLRRMESN